MGVDTETGPNSRDGGHRKLGVARRKSTGIDKKEPEHAHLHHALNDHSPVDSAEILTDWRKETAAGFWQCA